MSSRAKAAVDAAVDAQRALAEHTWPEDGEIRVRIGISTGEAALEGGRYVGFAVHRAARISAAGHGGQILLSSSTRDIVESDSVQASRSATSASGVSRTCLGPSACTSSLPTGFLLSSLP
jgi:class 3 adenylate cyclase